MWKCAEALCESIYQINMPLRHNFFFLIWPELRFQRIKFMRDELSWLATTECYTLRTRHDTAFIYVILNLPTNSWIHNNNKFIGKSIYYVNFKYCMLLTFEQQIKWIKSFCLIDQLHYSKVKKRITEIKKKLCLHCSLRI